MPTVKDPNATPTYAQLARCVADFATLTGMREVTTARLTRGEVSDFITRLRDARPTIAPADAEEVPF